MKLERKEKYQNIEMEFEYDELLDIFSCSSILGVAYGSSKSSVISKMKKAINKFFSTEIHDYNQLADAISDYMDFTPITEDYKDRATIDPQLLEMLVSKLLYQTGK